jgi:hypothetical protein
MYVYRKSTQAGQLPLVQSGRPTWAIGDESANHPQSPQLKKIMRKMITESDGRLSQMPYALKRQRRIEKKIKG